VPGSRADGPGRAELHRLYVVEQWSTADLEARYRVGSPKVRRWLLEAGVEIRSRGSGGYKRQLSAPPAEELAELGHELSVPEIATRLRVSDSTVRRWFTEAGLTPPSASLKNRPRGAPAPVERPTRAMLRQLYVREGLSISAVAQRLNSTTHLVRTWLLEDHIPIRPAGGRPGSRRPGRVRKPPPPDEVLRRLREQDRLTLAALAVRYRVHPQTVSGWLRKAGLPGSLPPPGPAVPDRVVASMYRAEPVSASEIARRLGITDSRALAALRREGVQVDPARQAAAVRAASARRGGTVPPLPADQGDQAVRYYRDEGWSYRMIGEHFGVSAAKVRAELRRRGIPGHRHRPAGTAGSRSARTEAPVEKLRQLYVDSEWSAQDVAAQLDSTIQVVLRTGHAHGVPIRQGGGGRPAVTATVAVIDSLYRDEQISRVLDRHDVPRRPAGGDIAVRFPEPVPLTASLLEELYHGAGCSTGQIELLTGQPQTVVRATMHRLGIALRPEHMSPALLRLRATARQDFLAQIVAEYRACGSTAEVARLHDCSTNTVLRWLAQAGVSVPGRGQWIRKTGASSGGS
jgi:transposase